MWFIAPANNNDLDRTLQYSRVILNNCVRSTSNELCFLSSKTAVRAQLLLCAPGLHEANAVGFAVTRVLQRFHRHVW